ncbi:rDNA transcriptional regulator pol5 isoform X1 [Ixodes scapularis]|uniref:rDNA transcriptional regulator pol5 isoform X1 n=2 Tax=Ixodes scapularis TaxID=6945 RepID=UPI001C37EDA2|nr:rDNA transcriptional regulator pol5 isoform X1 [Ixodes scapularis]
MSLAEPSHLRAEAVTGKQKSRFLDAFYNLADSKKPVRVNAAETIIKEIFKSDDQRDEPSKELNYTVERLVKGLPSTRKCARVGFAAALSQILQVFPAISAEEVLDYIDKHLPHDSKEDKNHVAIGRCLALSSLVRSGRADDVAGTVARRLLSVGLECPHLQLMACEVLRELLNQMNEKKFKKKVWPELRDDLSCGWDKCSPLVLFVLVLVAENFPSVVDPAFLRQHWKSDSIFDKNNFVEISGILQKSTSVHPHIHPACTAVLEAVLATKNFKKFWKQFVDDGLLNAGQEHKTFLALELFKWCLPRLSSAEKVEWALSQELRRHTIPAMCNGSHALHSVSRGLLQYLVDFAKVTSDAQIQTAILGFFVKSPSSILFDQVTKTKTVHQLLLSASPDCVQWYADHLKTCLQSEEGESQLLQGRMQCQAFEQLSGLLLLPSMAANSDFKTDVLHFFVDAYSGRFASGDDNAAQNVATRKVLQGAILRALVPAKKTKLSDFAELLVSLLAHMKAVSAGWRSSEARKQLKRARSLVDKVDSAAGLPESVATAFKVLLCYLTVLVSFEVAEDPSVLQDLCSCAKQLLAEEEEGERLDGWVHLVVDTTLSTLSMSSQPVRTVATAAFSLVRGHLSDASLALLLKVFRSKKDEDEDEDEEDEEEAMDEEMDEEESESEESDIDSEDKSGPDEELRARLRLALGTAAADEDAQESSEAEIVPTDEQMFQLDGAIAEAFKSRLGPSKKELSKEQTDNIHFQIRCLDLVTAYAEGGPPLHHLVKIVKVLVAASSLPEFRSNQAATNAVANALQAINGVRKFSSVSDVRDDIEALAATVMEQTVLVSNVNTKNALSATCTFLIRCHKKICSDLGVGSKGTPWYIAMYMKSLASYLDESSHVSPQLFVKFMEAFPDHCYDFIVALGEKAASCLQRNHKRLQMLGLLVAALRLIQVESVPKQKLGASLTQLADLSIKMLSEMVEKKEPKMSVAVELCDLLLLASKQSAAVGLESPVRGNTPLASTLASLKGFKVSKEKLLKRKINEILREIQGSKVTDASQGSKSQKKKRPASDEADAVSRKAKKKA